MNHPVLPCKTPLLTPRRTGTPLTHPFSFINHPSNTPLSLQTPSLPDCDSPSNAPLKKQIPIRHDCRVASSFLQGVTAAFVMLSVVITGMAQSINDETGLTFYGWSDQHVQASGDASHVIPVVDAMNVMEGTSYPEKVGGKVARPQFVLGAGDITEWPTIAAMKTYDDLLKIRLKIRAYDVIGNHDDGGLVPSETMKKWAIARHGGLSYTFDAGGVHFVMLWSAFDASKEPAQPLTTESLDYLRKELAKAPKDAPIIIATHLCHDAIVNKDALIDAIGTAKVILILGGHYHFASVQEYRGFRFVQLPSPKSEWTEFTVLRITPDRLIALPYDFVKRAWATEPRKILDIPVKPLR